MTLSPPMGVLFPGAEVSTEATGSPPTDFALTWIVKDFVLYMYVDSGFDAQYISVTALDISGQATSSSSLPRWRESEPRVTASRSSTLAKKG